MNREQKAEFVEKLKKIFSDHKIIIIMQNKGINVPVVNGLRADVRSCSSNYMVVKNTLAKIALSSLGLDAASDFFQGPVSIAYSNDPVSVSKVMKKFADDVGHLAIVGGLMDGSRVDEAVVRTLASMPSLDELRAKIIGAVRVPARRVWSCVTGPSSAIASILIARSKVE